MVNVIYVHRYPPTFQVYSFKVEPRKFALFMYSIEECYYCIVPIRQRYALHSDSYFGFTVEWRNIAIYSS